MTKEAVMKIVVISFTFTLSLTASASRFIRSGKIDMIFYPKFLLRSFNHYEGIPFLINYFGIDVLK
jgi:hypothetical protein